MWAGCSQAPDSTAKGQNWTWVDGTPASNLNCGPGNNGCGLWGFGYPNDGGGSAEWHQADGCGFWGGHLADLAMGSPKDYLLCEWDVWIGACKLSLAPIVAVSSPLCICTAITLLLVCLGLRGVVL